MKRIVENVEDQAIKNGSLAGKLLLVTDCGFHND